MITRLLGRLAVFILALVVLLGVSKDPATTLTRQVRAEGQSGTTLSASKTAVGHLTRTYDWTIDKTVAPATWNLFRGDSGTSMYTITVTKDQGTVEAWVDGQVCVTNGGAVATENLQIVDELRNGVPPPDDVIATISVDVSAHPVLAPGESYCYSYRVNIPSANIHEGATYKNTANVTITNHSGNLGTPFGPSPSATTNLPSTPTLVNDIIHVDDTNGSTFTFNASGSESYNKTFTCDADQGTHNNTATVRETGQSDSASVTVNCYALQVTKTAQTSFDRTYHWNIDKSADQSSLTLSTGQSFLVNYSVVVNMTGYTDSNWSVSGNISVQNPAPIPANINAVSDVISGVGSASVSCGVSFPYTLAAAGTLNCTYSANLPDATSRTNTATATLQNYSYSETGTATASGTTDFSGSAAVNFGGATINKIDECISVSDTYAGSLGTVCVGVDTLPKTFSYSRTVGPYSACGSYTVNNTASFVTNDTSSSGSDSWNIDINVPCVTGCTLTPGYWKTHSKYGPAPYDDAWALLTPSGEDSPFFDSGKSWYQTLWTKPADGAYYILAHAYIGAYLNQLNGASVPSNVQTAVNHAAYLLDQYDGSPNPMSSIKGAVRQDFINTASTLDQYNNGYIGPGHCSE